MQVPEVVFCPGSCRFASFQPALMGQYRIFAVWYLFWTVQHFCWFSFKMLCCPHFFVVPDQKTRYTFACSRAKMLCCPSFFWQNEEKGCTVPIFGAFGHQEALQVPKDCFCVSGTIQQFCCLGFAAFGTSNFEDTKTAGNTVNPQSKPR